MKIYIGYFQGAGPRSLLLAPSREMATVFWSGMGFHPSKIEEIDPDAASDGFPVKALIGTRNRRVSELSSVRETYIHQVVRGTGDCPL